jgi:hypothetical protein
MGADFSETSSRSSCDSDDDPEAALNPAGDDDIDNDNVAPRFRLRRLPQGSQDAASALLPGEGTAISVYVMMHRYGRTCPTTYHGRSMALTG